MTRKLKILLHLVIIKEEEVVLFVKDTNFDNNFKTGNYFKWNSDYTKCLEVVLYGIK